MPSHRTHRVVSELLLGNPYEEVHRIKDAPYRWLGRRHRILFHDPVTGLLFFRKDKGALTASLLHDATDALGSSMKKSLRGCPFTRALILEGLNLLAASMLLDKTKKSSQGTNIKEPKKKWNEAIF